MIIEGAESYLSTRAFSIPGLEYVDTGAENISDGIMGTTGTTNGYTKHGIKLDDSSANVNGTLEHSRNAPSRVFVLSSFSGAASKFQIQKFLTYLDEKDRISTDEWLENLAFTLYKRRSQFTWKLAVSASSIDELKTAITARELDFTQALYKTPRLGFVFTGQGAQWHAMGRELFDVYPVYHDAIVEADHHLVKLGAEWSLAGIYTIFSPHFYRY